MINFPNTTKTYLVLLSTDHDRDKVKEFIDATQSVDFWFFSMPYSLFINTKMSANEIFDLLENKFGEKKLFVTQIPDSSFRQGRLPKDHWQYFK
ncbi:MAG: hypothetical protein IPP32_13070 [Bacteroidetes bacterium]|nr:hypothetical protein [Bacteroidota bacterium]